MRGGRGGGRLAVGIMRWGDDGGRRYGEERRPGVEKKGYWGEGPRMAESIGGRAATAGNKSARSIPYASVVEHERSRGRKERNP